MAELTASGRSEVKFTSTEDVQRNDAPRLRLRKKSLPVKRLPMEMVGMSWVMLIEPWIALGHPKAFPEWPLRSSVSGPNSPCR